MRAPLLVVDLAESSRRLCPRRVIGLAACAFVADLVVERALPAVLVAALGDEGNGAAAGAAISRANAAAAAVRTELRPPSPARGGCRC